MTPPNNKFDILIYGEFFFPVIGGVQTAMHLLAKGLMEMDSQPEKNAGLGEIEVILVTKTAANGMDDSTLPYRVIRRPSIWQLVKLIRESEVIHIAGPCMLPMLISWLMRKPFVVEHHGYQAICPNGLLFKEPSRTVCPGYFGQRQYGKCLRCTSTTMGFLGGLRAIVLTFPRRWLCAKVPVNITISDHVAARLKLPQTRTVYYGIEKLTGIRTDVAPLSKGPFRLAYVGRLVTEKGPGLLLHAAKRLTDVGVPFHLAFIGDGPERSRLETLAETLELSSVTTFTGDLRGPKLEEAVGKIDLVVMPSLCEETAGLSAIEQMMRGRVVVVADIGGLSEVVASAGLKFPPGDPRALATCIRKIIEDPQLAVALGSEGRARAVESFTVENMIRNHVAVYRGLTQ
jgi:glycosyltransferase involved in cell wall biosynthesis